MPDRNHKRPGLSGLAGVLLLAGLALPQAANAQACLQENALYADRSGTLVLRFRPIDSGVAVASNMFEMGVSRENMPLEGFVIWNEGFSRPNAILMYNCPEGDATGEEIDACTLWQGVVYTLAENADAGLLPAAGEPAAPALLLPDLGRALHYSVLRDEGMFERGPDDVFHLKGCAP